jgi:hypothetical protein
MIPGCGVSHAVMPMHFFEISCIDFTKEESRCQSKFPQSGNSNFSFFEKEIVRGRAQRPHRDHSPWSPIILLNFAGKGEDFFKIGFVTPALIKRIKEGVKTGQSCR